MILKSTLLISFSALTLSAEKIPFFIGTGSQEGIFTAMLDTDSGEISQFKNAIKTNAPGALAISANKKFLYSVGRNRGQKHGFVASYKINSDQSLSLLNQQSSMGAGPCHLSLDTQSKHLFTANYSGGSVTSYTLKLFDSLKDGVKAGAISPAVSHHQHKGASVHPQRQTRPHAHSIYSSPDNKYVYSADLGIDQILIYKLDLTSGKLTPAGSTKTPAGGGPRHMVFSNNGDTLYALNELTVSVSQYSRNPETGALKLLQTKPLMAKNEDRMTCSEVSLSADGRFLYATCRDLAGKGRDLISVLDRESLSIIQEQPAGVWIPRHFSISPSGKWLLIAGQKADKVIVHARDTKSGKLRKTHHSVALKRPMWILFP